MTLLSSLAPVKAHIIIAPSGMMVVIAKVNWTWLGFEPMQNHKENSNKNVFCYDNIL
jgi:hypothetical protein